MNIFLKKCAHRSYGRIIRWGQEFHQIPEYLVKVMAAAVVKIHNKIDYTKAKKNVQTHTSALREETLKEMKVRRVIVEHIMLTFIKKCAHDLGRGTCVQEREYGRPSCVRQRDP